MRFLQGSDEALSKTERTYWIRIKHRDGKVRSTRRINLRWLVETDPADLSRNDDLVCPSPLIPSHFLASAIANDQISLRPSSVSSPLPVCFLLPSSSHNLEPR